MMANPVVVVRRTSRYGDEDRFWRTVWMWCPGCDSAKAIPTAAEDGTLPPDGPHWEFDGNLEAPTLSPSILQHQSGSVPQCHSYVKAGQWEFLGDCTHALAGKTVPMVPLPDYLVPD